jgi:hypothetical protein
MLQQKSKLDVYEFYDFIKLFGDKVLIKKWIMHRLPSDSFSITNAVVIDMCQRVQTIIVDPQYQANIWLQSFYKGNTGF